MTLLVRVSGQFFHAVHGRADGRDERLHRAGLVVVVLPLILLSGLLVIIPLAFASPPDPTWIAGIYDNADYDDVVQLVTDGTGASTGQRPARVAEGPGTFGVLPEPGQVPSRIPCAEMNRGPPPLEASTILCSSQPPRSDSPNSLRRTVFCSVINVMARSC